MSNVKKFVLSQDNKKRNYAQKLAEIEDLANMEYHGSRIIQDVHLLIIAGDILDKDGRGLFLLPKEENPIVDGPFLRVIETHDRYRTEDGREQNTEYLYFKTLNLPCSQLLKLNSLL